MIARPGRHGQRRAILEELRIEELEIRIAIVSIRFSSLAVSTPVAKRSVLLRRTFGFDSLRCPKCHARMRLLATVTDPGTVKKILTHLGVRTEPLPRARARDPTGQESFHFDAA